MKISQKLMLGIRTKELLRVLVSSIAPLSLSPSVRVCGVSMHFIRSEMGRVSLYFPYTIYFIRSALLNFFLLLVSFFFIYFAFNHS